MLTGLLTVKLLLLVVLVVYEWLYQYECKYSCIDWNDDDEFHFVEIFIHFFHINNVSFVCEGFRLRASGCVLWSQRWCIAFMYIICFYFYYICGNKSCIVMRWLKFVNRKDNLRVVWLLKVSLTCLTCLNCSSKLQPLFCWDEFEPSLDVDEFDAGFAK